MFDYPLVRRTVLALACLVLAAPAAAQYTRVTVGVGGAQPNGPIGSGVISADGRFVVFDSAATNLVAGDGNASTDVFVRELQTATTTRVSVTQDGQERSGDSGTDFDTSTDGTGQFDISGDGRYVVFQSRAPLVAGDTAQCEYGGVTGNCPDIYLRDRIGNTTTRVSTGFGGAEPNGASHSPRISDDGKWIVYASEASNLIGLNDTNGVTDVFLYSIEQPSTVRVSVATGGIKVDLPSLAPSISADGGIIAFVSASTTLSPDPDPIACERGPSPCRRAFVVDRAAGTTRRVPAPAIVTSRQFGFAFVTFRIEVDEVFVSPDGATVAVNSTSIPSVLGVTTRNAENWIGDRAGARVIADTPGTVFASWDGHRYTYRQITSAAPVVTGGVGITDLRDGFVESLAPISQIAQARAGNLSTDGRYAILVTTEGKAVDDSDGLLDVYVVDRDADADGMPSAWETFFNLNPGTPIDAALDADGDGVSNLAEYQRGSHPRGTHARYLAEGASNTFFQTTVSVANPGATAGTVVARFLGDNGRTWSTPVAIPGRQERVLNADGRFSASFSTVIESDQPMVADRVMTWGDGYGSHSETATAAPSTTWFLAEGATHGAFQLFYLLQNPGSTPANVQVTYLRPTPREPISIAYTIAPEARLTIPVDAVPGLAETDVSARIISSVPILVERSMYMNTANPVQVFGAGHAGSGVTATNTRWFLAEGATGVFFDMYYLIANPSTSAAEVQVTYLLPTGAPLVKTYTVAGQSRRTIGVDLEDERLLDTPVSAILESTNGVGIVVERSMWWPGQGQWQEGHLSAGSTTTARRWAVAGGVSGPSAETFVLIANTSASAGTATLTVLRSHAGGAATTHQVALPPNSRVNVPASQVPGLAEAGGTEFGMLIESDGPEIVVERATYVNHGGITWAAGHASLGTPLP